MPYGAKDFFALLSGLNYDSLSCTALEVVGTSRFVGTTLDLGYVPAPYFRMPVEALDDEGKLPCLFWPKDDRDFFFDGPLKGAFILAIASLSLLLFVSLPFRP
jgi:hypothetical protein